MKLFTVGYSGLTLRPLRDWLDTRDAVLVDVRYKPFSRVPEWRQAALRRALGPRYRHVPEFGNLSYKTGGPIRLADETGGVQAVSALLRKQSVVLMCMCADHAGCHRTVAANAVGEATGVEVVHLSSSDLTSKRQLELL